MRKDSRIYVAGHRGLVGSAIRRKLEAEGYTRLLLRTSQELDLRSQQDVGQFFKEEQPEYVFVAAAKVGGIHANRTFPADFIYDNLAIEINLINAAWRHGVTKLQFLGSSCVYPKFSPQPIREEHLLTGELEPTNEAYAVAKIAGIKLAQAYRSQYGFDAISLMPTNLYGPGDNFDLQNSHVLPALIRKFHEALVERRPEVVLWGTGTVRREFLHVDDLADAAVFLMTAWNCGEIINVGTGEDLTIRELAEIVASVVGFEGAVRFDPSMPDGTPRKLLDVSRLTALGWKPRIPLAEGIRSTYQWFRENAAAPTHA
ncbi:MAG TPA: GDP-L-fucose synthase [Bryobacteraceae bacterium]|nr:GDP-L-fucose synthase [Bryobacteraceae bacterium]